MITTEKHEVTIVRGGEAKKGRGFCPACSGDVELLTFDTAVNVSGSSGLDLVQPIAAGEIHSVETVHVCEGTRGRTFICGESLFNYFAKITEVVSNE